LLFLPRSEFLQSRDSLFEANYFFAGNLQRFFLPALDVVEFKNFVKPQGQFRGLLRQPIWQIADVIVGSSWHGLPGRFRRIKSRFNEFHTRRFVRRRHRSHASQKIANTRITITGREMELPTNRLTIP
ncbi:MAG: hypothetical protein WBE94_21840, partial [Pseudolabrys sp.]